MTVGGYIFTGILVLVLVAACVALVWQARHPRSSGRRSYRGTDAGIDEARAYSEIHSQANNYGPF